MGSSMRLNVQLFIYLLLSLSMLQQALAASATDALLMPRVAESLLLDIVRVDSRLIVVGERGHILYSDDNADSWSQAPVPVRQMLTAVHFASTKLGWAVGHDGLILASNDGGQHWVLQRNGLNDQAFLNRQNLKTQKSDLQGLQRALLATDSQARRESLKIEVEELTLDIEDSQALLREPVFAPPLLDVFFSDALRGVAIGAFNTLVMTRDGGASWSLASALPDNPEEFHLNAVTGDGMGNVWIAGEGGVIFKSTDYGGSWITLDSPYPGSWFGMDFSKKSARLLLFGLRGNVFYSDDAGESWQRSRLPGRRSLAGGGFINEDYAVLAGSVGTLLLSDDGGESFVPIAMGSRVNLSAVTCRGGRAVAVGQGGVHIGSCVGDVNE
jgi:photosystem II stability/assembly factor-like uncharacterized protein